MGVLAKVKGGIKKADVSASIKTLELIEGAKTPVKEKAALKLLEDMEKCFSDPDYSQKSLEKIRSYLSESRKIHEALMLYPELMEKCRKMPEVAKCLGLKSDDEDKVKQALDLMKKRTPEEYKVLLGKLGEDGIKAYMSDLIEEAEENNKREKE
ncbi:MAG: hypothetical protein IKQ31_01790 [Clostridia bacterium]|nr:hypothetical protein [Clostridia bacterium]